MVLFHMNAKKYMEILEDGLKPNARRIYISESNI
jgi:hypothetical protein